MNKLLINRRSNPQQNSTEFGWRDERYKRFYYIVDQLVEEIQSHKWKANGQTKRKVTSHSLEKLTYSVECIVRDCVAVVLQRGRKAKASIHLGQHHYSANRDDKMLTYKIHVKRAYCGLSELGYIKISVEK